MTYQARRKATELMIQALAAKPEGIPSQTGGESFAEEIIAGATKIAEFIYSAESTESDGEQ